MIFSLDIFSINCGSDCIKCSYWAVIRRDIHVIKSWGPKTRNYGEKSCADHTRVGQNFSL